MNVYDPYYTNRKFDVFKRVVELFDPIWAIVKPIAIMK
jgi:hypothetical protein